MKRTLLAILFFAALVAIWAALVRAEIWSPVLLPSPRNVVDYLASAARDGSLLSASIVTLRRLLLDTSLVSPSDFHSGFLLRL